MSRLSIPAVVDAPAASQPLLAVVHKKLGVVPNLMKLLGQSPAALEGFLSLSGALDKGVLNAKLRESLALAVAEFNGCDYCLAAHSYIGKNLVKLTDDEIAQARDGRATDARNDAALRAAGFSDAETVEIVLHVALNVLTNYVNNVAHTDVDFPRVSAHTHA